MRVSSLIRWFPCMMICIPALHVGAVSTAAPVTAFVDVAVVPMDRERVLTDQTVLVQREHITALGPADRVRVPKNAVRIDGRGKFLIPGLTDMHVHLEVADSVGAEQMLLLFVATGITTIRDMAYLSTRDVPHVIKLDGTNLLQLRARAAAGTLLSPRIYTSGRPPWRNDTNANTVAQEVAAYKAMGYDFIKVHDETPIILDSVAAAAHRLAIPFAGHVPAGTPLEHALTLGYASIEHLRGYDIYLSRDSAFLSMADSVAKGMSDSALWRATRQAVDTSKVPLIAAETQLAGVWNCPTQVGVEGVAPGLRVKIADQHRPELRYVTSRTRANWDSQEESNIVWNAEGRWNARVAMVGRWVIPALQHAGAGLLSGTDTPGPYEVPGFALLRELETLVQVGLTPYQALATSTRNVAVYFRTLHESGTIEVGKRADLVLLLGNPLVDIRFIEQRAGVMLDGRWHSQAELDRHLATVVGKLNMVP